MVSNSQPNPAQTATTEARPTQPPLSQSANSTAPQRRQGRMPGSQGYNTDDCVGLIKCVGRVMPMGPQQWSSVQEAYHKYADKNNRSHREIDSLKHKFRAIANSRKPTGDPNCPAYIRDAKRIQIEIDQKTRKYVAEDQSDDEQNGDGAHMEDSQSLDRNASPGSQVSNSSETSPNHQESEPNIPTNDDINDQMELDDQSSSHHPPTNESQASKANLCRRGASSSSQRIHHTYSPMNSSTRRSQRGRRGLDQCLETYFDPEARDNRERDQGMASFYAARLKEANTKIEALSRENQDLSTKVDNEKRDLKAEVDRLRAESTKKSMDIRDLRGKLDLLQLKLDLYKRGQFQPQPRPMYNYQGPYMTAGHAMQTPSQTAYAPAAQSNFPTQSAPSVPPPVPINSAPSVPPVQSSYQPPPESFSSMGETNFGQQNEHLGTHPSEL
ncbi:uncharacterized protein PGTG_02525 [Puccinia graminis f. sp. tritici CRL 75-36-700-3]|uniref:DUF6818 domain-containing protein n=1 Tax=Puccinia graminis f. sp. tritici (strain CRL 75-36-700-3 / race SCCL) TaxID=418459 RepID=E3JVK9_PUCGT|nr:uncharacterized protein PGTG_02525 [Puccinia graminis f. sp. tritici CRL 75-36-700-3]EFP76084.1 hypothetical protein PGTG_02525 [Puccinia graminis f. sp. tritici CRL 75-36-700-3]